MLRKHGTLAILILIALLLLYLLHKRLSESESHANIQNDMAADDIVLKTVSIDPPFTMAVFKPEIDSMISKFVLEHGYWEKHLTDLLLLKVFLEAKNKRFPNREEFLWSVDKTQLFVFSFIQFFSC